MSQNAQNTIFREVGLLFQPLTSLNSAHRVTALFRELGYELPGGNDFPNFPGLAARVEGVIQAVIKFDQAADDSQTDALAELALAIIRLTEEIISLEQAVSNAVAAFPSFVANAPLDELPLRLLDYLIIEHTRRYRRPVHAVMNILGVFEMVELPADGVIFQPETSLRKIFWNRLPLLVSNPIGLFDDVYNWSTDFNSDKLFTNLDTVLRAFLLPGGLYEQNPSLKSALGNTTDNLKELRFPILQNAVFPSIYSQFGINVTSAEAQGPKKSGFAIVPYVIGTASFDFDLNETFEIIFETTASVDAGLGIVIRSGDIELITNLFDAPLDAVNLNVQLRLQQRGSTKEIILFGASNATRLAIEGLAMKVFVSTQGGDKDVGFEVQLDAIRLVVTGGEGDGFLSTILGDGGINAEAGFVLGYSHQRGLHFVGSGGLEIQLPTHITLGPLEIQGLILALKIKNSDFNIEGGANIKVDMGPLVAVVENIGITTVLSFPNGGGNLGPANLAVDFKPPNGVGLAIDAGAVKGGGYLFFDPDREEYAGALELVFSEWIAFKAIGLITTKLPDGSKGFSLLIIITVEFGTGIQLGFGFTLLGVGGILGLHRIVRIEPLTEGVRTGAVESVMFPENVIANAPRIISDLRKFFPPQRDIFLVGPMAKIGWGTPTLVSVQLGIVLEFPNVNITILGVIKVVLPDEDADVLRLQVNFIGRIEPSNKLLWFYAELFDSRVLFITLEGGFGLLVNWGDNANFIVSVGGFHPRYNPPPLPFPEPPRLAVSLLNESYAKIRIEGYFAVTSNSVQFGARVELFFGLSEFSIEGHLAFDALFLFDPFFFSFGLSISLSVKVFGMGLFSVGFSGLLEGPTPWFIKGKGKIGFLFFSISVPFEHTWGRSQDTTLDPIAVYPLLEAEFNALTNWQAEVPDNSRLLVSLRKLGETDSDQLVLHPVGRLLISQRKVPVNFRLDKVGNQKPADYNKIVVAAELSGGGLLSVSKVEEQFAIGQFKDLDGSNRLSTPGFEPLESGIAIGMPGEQMKTSRGVRRVIRYETIIIDSNFKRHVKTFFSFFDTGYSALNDFLFTHFLIGNSATQSALSKHQRERMQPFNEVITVQPHQYSVVFNTDNRPMDSTATTFSSQAAASQYLEEQISEDAGLAKRLHVVPNTEVHIGA